MDQMASSKHLRNFQVQRCYWNGGSHPNERNSRTSHMKILCLSNSQPEDLRDDLALVLSFAM